MVGASLIVNVFKMVLRPSFPHSYSCTLECNVKIMVETLGS